MRLYHSVVVALVGGRRKLDTGSGICHDRAEAVLGEYPDAVVVFANAYPIENAVVRAAAKLLPPDDLPLPVNPN